MKLWLVRHGEAAPMQADDAARELTARGQADIRALGNLLARDHVRVDQIIVSPYVRARQT
ncbi:MAG TPA: histidine phosphatase family protein [Pseudomonadales bacterium]